MLLESLKEYIHEMYKPPVLEKGSAVLNFMNVSDKYTTKASVKCFTYFVSKNITIFVETSSKPFSEWTFLEVLNSMGLAIT
jgi:hypothetical protein